ncbi:MAG: hypothetical protein GQE15_25875 [Archangiaceae bacterium]|nr:hypothetical protein [Archangiaceae bacterium]
MLQTFTEEELVDLTPRRARDLVVQCFFNAQVETFKRAATKLGSSSSPEQLQRTVEGAVRLAFRSTKGDFENPTKETLMAAVMDLANKAAAMGTPHDIIEHHKQQLGRVFEVLAQADRAA